MVCIQSAHWIWFILRASKNEVKITTCCSIKTITCNVCTQKVELITSLQLKDPKTIQIIATYKTIIPQGLL